MSSLWLPSLEQAITIGVIHNLPHVNLENEIRYGPTDPEFATIYETLIGLLQGTDEESRNIILAAVENAPTRRGQLILLNAISARSQGEMPLSKVAEWIKKNIVTPFRVTGGRRMTSNNEINPFKDPLGVWGTGLFATAASRSQDSLRKKIMQRDNGQCVITGRIDPSAVRFGSQPQRRIECTIAAHILPFSLCDFGQNPNNWGNKQVQLNNYWTSIQSFSGVEMNSLTGAGINDPTNAITLSSTVHTYYDRLELALKPIFPDTGKIDPKNYQCQVAAFTPTAVWLLQEHGFVAADKYSAISANTIEFKSNADIDPPNPYSLAMHWSASEIYARCAAREKLETILSSNDDLHNALEAVNNGIQPNLATLPDAFESLTGVIDAVLVHSDTIQEPLDAISYRIEEENPQPSETIWDKIRNTVN